MTVLRIRTEPPWSTREAQAGELVLRGRTRSEVWGFGQHPSTSLCLSILAGMFGDGGPQPKRVVELACGTGLLCVAAAKLGARSTRGLEPDAGLRKIAEENAHGNDARGLMFAATADELDIQGFDLTLANLTAPELHAQSELLARLAAGGHLLISGFVEEEREAIEQRFIGLGFRFLFRELREQVLACVLKSRAAEARGDA